MLLKILTKCIKTRFPDPDFCVKKKQKLFTFRVKMSFSDTLTINQLNSLDVHYVIILYIFGFLTVLCNANLNKKLNKKR